MALWVAGCVLVAVGLAGVVVPALPGTALVFAGLVAGAAADGFERVGWGTLAVLGALTALSFLVDFAAAALGIRRTGASRLAVVGAALGSIAGLLLGPWGFLLGPFLGALTGELLARRDLRQAGRAGLGAWLGFLLGTLAKLAICLAMLGIFAVAYLV